MAKQTLSETVGARLKKIFCFLTCLITIAETKGAPKVAKVKAKGSNC